jgi:hypothetical protein
MWWQVYAPRGTLENSDLAVYNPVAADLRNDNGVPKLIYALRGGSDYGAKVFRPIDLTTTSGTTCTSSPTYQGTGENLQSTTLLPYVQLQTHVELEADANGVVQCQINVPCAPQGYTGMARNLFNNRSTVFTLQDSQNTTHTILAVAAGFPAAARGQGQLGSCVWWDGIMQGQSYYGQPMVVFYDVTDTATPPFPPTQPPPLLRVALGQPETDHQTGNAFAIAAETVGSGAGNTAYVFVGDVMGRLLAFGVTYDGTTNPLTPPASTPYLKSPPTPILFPTKTLAFPKDPYDGYPCNCVDVEIQGDYLYCALGRAGVGVVGANPNDTAHWMKLVYCLDTPGVAFGLSIRSDPVTPTTKQLIVGDSRCGVRVYQ